MLLPAFSNSFLYTIGILLGILFSMKQLSGSNRFLLAIYSRRGRHDIHRLTQSLWSRSVPEPVGIQMMKPVNKYMSYNATPGQYKTFIVNAAEVHYEHK